MNKTRSAARRSALIAAMMGVFLAGSATATSAQGLFDLFNVRRDPAPTQQMTYAEPPAPVSSPRPVSTAPSGRVTYCVRLCDGRYFPVQSHSAASAAELCNSFCPASPTKVFSGSSDITHATARDGSRYSALENAFVYRTRVVTDCTCNGKDSFGLAQVDIKADPTVRSGDLLATENGPVAALAVRSNR